MVALKNDLRKSVRGLFPRTALLNILFLAMTSLSAHGTAAEIVQNTRVFKLGLGATRIIYHPGQAGATLSATNPQSFPVLVQSQVFNEDRKTQAPFVVTPPLFRLDPGQRNVLRILGTGSSKTGTQESLYWLCVTGIPPKDGDVWAEERKNGAASLAQVNMEVSTHMCIKLINRPAGLNGNLMQAANALHWTREDKAVVARNDSPYYISFSSLEVDGRRADHPDYIAPFSVRSFNIPGRVGSNVNWVVITDSGGKSRRFSALVE
ncbi:fimbria/pilus periplasmic chaperone [Enterobacter kobei]|nr:fimbria/pilus periplasmic chaperone [Enterobacter kobei]